MINVENSRIGNRVLGGIETIIEEYKHVKLTCFNIYFFWTLFWQDYLKCWMMVGYAFVTADLERWG